MCSIRISQTAAIPGVDNLGIAAGVERTMRLQDVLLKAMAKNFSWMEAAEIPG